MNLDHYMSIVRSLRGTRNKLQCSRLIVPESIQAHHRMKVDRFVPRTQYVNLIKAGQTNLIRSNHFAETSSASKVGSYLRLIYLYHSTLGWRLMNKKKT